MGGVPEIIRHGYNGFLVEPTNIEEIANYIDALVEDGRLREKMSRNACNFVRKNYDWRIIANKVLLTYKNMVNKKYNSDISVLQRHCSC